MTAPVVTSINTAPVVSETVTIIVTGSGFVDPTTVVVTATDSFSNNYILPTGAVTVTDTTHITFSVTTDLGIPSGAAINIAVTNANGSGNHTVTTTIAAAPASQTPIVSDIKPKKCDDITTPAVPITITGQHFGGTTGVTVGGTAVVSFDVMDDSHISINLPSKAVGVYDIVVTNATGASATSSADQITYLQRVLPTGATTVYVVRDDFGNYLPTAYTTLNLAKTAAAANGLTNSDAVTAVQGTVVNSVVTSWIDPS